MSGNDNVIKFNKNQPEHHDCPTVRLREYFQIDFDEKLDELFSSADEGHIHEMQIELNLFAISLLAKLYRAATPKQIPKLKKVLLERLDEAMEAERLINGEAK